MMAEEKKRKSVSEKEEETLRFWNEHKIFEKSLEARKGAEVFVFYDGPPFATGLPHYGHLEQSIVKDAIPRYQTMRGKYVPRQWGWDCHGLPIENIVEQQLGLKSKKDIVEYGIGKFNEVAKKEVLRFAEDWKKIIPRIGRWVDMEHDYKTMDPAYTETVWWIFKNLYDKGLIEEGYKSMHLCPRCETTLANFEVAQGYKDIKDISVTVKFELVSESLDDARDKPKTYVLAWTTTPWTLPGNVALAVGKDIEYIKVEKDGALYILAKDVAEKVVAGGRVVGELRGSELVGKKYKPLFDYFANDPNVKNKENGWRIYPADFVKTEEGTGIVHVAPAFGDEDMQLGKEYNLPFIQHVTRDGKFVEEVKDFRGQLVKPKGRHQDTDKEIVAYLEKNGALFSKQEIEHSYPHCWRCDTPLLNYAASSWFVMVTKIKDKLVEANSRIAWTPEHLKGGRFGKGLETAPDWAISRSRFWGAPLPVWRCEDCKKVETAGSLAELEARRYRAPNTFLIMRHGERDDVSKEEANQAEKQASIIIHSYADADIHVTEEGKRHVLETAKALKEKGGADIIFSSLFARAKESAEILSRELDVPVEFDERLRELDHGPAFEGATVAEYHAFYKHPLDRFTTAPEGGETLADIRRRVMNLVRELDFKHEGKRILIVGHGDPLWILESSLKNLSKEETLEARKTNYIKEAEARELTVPNYPFNDDGEIDFHRPYIDAVCLKCTCGGRMARIPEVFDCWFESGSMPYGRRHYPFDSARGTYGAEFDPVKNIGFPADFIAESIEMTRGWFYSLHVLATALFDQPASKTIFGTGTVLAEDGQKMSKHLKNYPDPMQMVNTYGADTVRFYILSSPLMLAENLNFSERGLDEISKKVIARLENIVSFYEMYKSGARLSDEPRFNHVLDKFLAYELYKTKDGIERACENYRLDRASRQISDFVDIFSTVYLQYSRDRFKEGEDGRDEALATLGWAIRETSKIIAPFMPFLAERVYQEMKGDSDPESVHLENWPAFSERIRKFEPAQKEMYVTRQAIELNLAYRAKAGISVRQPLALSAMRELPQGIEYQEIIKKRVNVDKVVEDRDLPEGINVQLDTNLTPELRDRGMLREVTRGLQDLRKTEGLKPGDKIKVFMFAPEHRPVLESPGSGMMRVVGATEILFVSAPTEGFTKLPTGDSVRIEQVS